jgi:prevent-host-death family protein
LYRNPPGEPMIQVNVSELRKNLRALLERVRKGDNEEIVIAVRGKPRFALVKYRDWKFYNDMEDMLLARAARRAAAADDASGEPDVPWERVKAELDALDAAEERAEAN